MASVTATQRDPATTAARMCLYRFMSLALMDPQRGNWAVLDDDHTQAVVRQAAEWTRTLPSARAGDRTPAEEPLEALDPASVLAALPRDAEALNEQFEQTFGLLSVGAVPECETEYIPGKLTFQRSNALADIAGFYRAFGFQPSRVGRERPDHIVLQLEFMARLCRLELDAEAAAADAANCDSPARADICRDAQRRFFAEHMAWWIPGFCRLLRENTASPFYRAVARVLAAWIAAERGLLGIPPRNRPAAPERIERPEECDGCQLAGLC